MTLGSLCGIDGHDLFDDGPQPTVLSDEGWRSGL